VTAATLVFQHRGGSLDLKILLSRLIILFSRLAGYVESLSNKLGFEGPQMNSVQLQMTRTVVATNLVNVFY
jgi:hypothetical protein